MAAVGGSVTYPVKLVAQLPWIWQHQCGHLNRGRWTAGMTCLGCRFEVRDQSERHLYLLVDAEPDEDGEG